MKLLSSDSYNIAWFKLADFVARGEKERALSVYKLLMHSVADAALSYQLEGDILLAFNDDVALEKYHLAANMYKKNGKFQKAIAVYEHVTLFKEDVTILEALLDTYDLLKQQNGIIDAYARFAAVAARHGNIGLLINKLHAFLIHNNQVLMAELYACTVITLLLHNAQNSHITIYLQQALEGYVLHDKVHCMNKFLEKLKATDKVYHQKAIDYLQKS